MDGRELIFTGRRKDLIILDGSNHYPQDIEETAEKSHPALRPGCSIAFSVDSEGPVRVLLVCELSSGYCLREQTAAPGDIQVARKDLEAAIRREVSEEHGIRLHEIVVIPTATIPKTSSGKLQRRGCKASYLDGSLVRL
jgi:acyl-CoA synthetase (AMP-forming)/AMP-acid ligase II